MLLYDLILPAQISGIGKVTEKMLNALEVTTCRDLYEQRAVLHLLFSQTSSQSFLRICLGISSAEVHRYGTLGPLRSIGMVGWVR